MSDTEVLVDEEQTEFEYDELSESAQQRAKEKMYEFNTEYGWWDSCKEDLVQNVLPDDWFIEDVDKEHMYFDLERGRYISLTGGMVNANKFIEAHPEEVPHLALQLIAKQGGFYRVPVRLCGRHEDTVGVETIGYEYDLTGTPFDGMSDDEFNDLIKDALEDLEDTLEDLVRRAAEACLTALDEEHDFLTSDEELESMARGYVFDEEGDLI